jgi:hypothetical protein
VDILFVTGTILFVQNNRLFPLRLGASMKCESKGIHISIVMLTSFVTKRSEFNRTQKNNYCLCAWMHRKHHGPLLSFVLAGGDLLSLVAI